MVRSGEVHLAVASSVDTHTHTHTHTRTYIHTYVYTYIYAYTNIHIHIHIIRHVLMLYTSIASYTSSILTLPALFAQSCPLLPVAA